MALEYPALIEDLKVICRTAGDAMMALYHDDITVLTKSDDTPVTEADQQAHRVIEAGLAKILAGVPVLSEEGEIPALVERATWQRYWLVDPLDGTKEFIEKTDHFTVNIALMEDNQPVLGIIYAPVQHTFYYGGHALGHSWREVDGQAAELINTRPCAPNGQLHVGVSRHCDLEELDDLLAVLEQRFAEVVRITVGSSLKGCLIADGAIDIYPRRGPTCEWDTAAAQAIVEGAGGQVLDSALQPLRYNQRESLVNPDFFIIGDPNVEWDTLLIP